MGLLILFFLPFLINIAETLFERKFKATINPGLPSGVNISSDLVYISAMGTSDQLHYLWTTFGVPTVLIVQTDLNARINVDYKKLFYCEIPSGAISFNNGSIQNSFAVVFNQLFEFEDDNESGDISNQTVYSFPLNNSFNRNLTVENTSQAVDQIFTSDFSNAIKIEMSICNGEKRHVLLPHLQYTANSTQVELIVERPAMFNKSRLAVEMFIYSNVQQIFNMTFHNSKSIDDEYTPGIFEINDLSTPSQSSDPHYGGYVQWKPLSYQSSSRAVNDIARLTHYPVIDADPNETQSPIIQAFYNETLLSIMIKKTNFSFGEKGDDFYKTFNSWTINIGLGIPADEKISSLVITTIAVIMSLPTILFIGGFVGLKIRKRIQPKIRSAYEPIM